MNKSIKKLIAMTIMTTTILGVSITPAKAEWKQDNNGWWNTEGNSWSIGWKEINGKWYYFGQDGYMVHDTTINGYKIGGDGTWIQNTSTNSNNTTNTNVSNTATSNSNNSSNTVNNVDASTKNNSSTTLNNTGVINANTTNNVDVTVDNTSKEEKKYYKNQNSAMKTYYEEQLKQAKDDLSEAQSYLNNVKNQKTVQTYKKNNDGVWDFVYVADQSKIDFAEKKVKSAENNVEYYEKLVKQYS